VPGAPSFVISDDRVLVGGMQARISYDNDQLLQAKNEYNKAALSAAALKEYKQVFDRSLPEKTTEHPPRESRKMWTGLRTT
jgi:hypothetical protein